jgi:FO synthase subunit 2
MLGPTFQNLQVSWVKQGLPLSRELLDFGVNDLGGTLMNESISTAAGADHGQFVSPARLRALAREAGRPPAERSTMYRIRRAYGLTPEEGEDGDALDQVDDAEAAFGSYAQLTHEARFRFRKARDEAVSADQLAARTRT